MYSFSKRSIDNLNTCHNDLQTICHEAIKIMDFTVLEGHRDKERQERAFKHGKSKARWGESRHNTTPSEAIDLAPYPIDWSDTERFARLAGIITAIAHLKGIKIKWGGEFKSIKDMPHFELRD